MSEENKQSGNYYRTEVIAKLFGFESSRRIQQLTQDGIIETVEVVENGRKVRRYDLIPTVRKYIQYLSEKAYSKPGRSEKEMELREQKMEADIALKESQGELHRLKTSIAAGEYISVKEARLDYAKFFVTFKKFAMSLPARVSGMLSGQLEPVEARRVEKEISSEITTFLNSFVIAGVVKPSEVKDILDGDAEMEKKVSSN